MDSEARAALTPIKLRYKAKAYALKAVDAQRSQFRRYGVWGDWEAPYLTLNPEYEAAQIGVFGSMLANGHVYRGRKPVNWSPSSRTALAEAELEYPDGHVSRSVYVAMALTQLPAAFPAEAAAAAGGAALVIWTTTAWTIPANAAVALNASLTYSVAAVGAPGGPGLAPGSRLVVAADLVGALSAKWGCPLEVVASFPGAALEGALYAHPLEGRVQPVVMGGDYITTESGTGLVHTAPGHGQEDYQVRWAPLCAGGSAPACAPSAGPGAGVGAAPGPSGFTPAPAPDRTGPPACPPVRMPAGGPALRPAAAVARRRRRPLHRGGGARPGGPAGADGRHRRRHSLAAGRRRAGG